MKGNNRKDKKQQVNISWEINTAYTSGSKKQGGNGAGKEIIHNSFLIIISMASSKC